MILAFMGGTKGPAPGRLRMKPTGLRGISSINPYCPAPQHCGIVNQSWGSCIAESAFDADPDHLIWLMPA